MSRALLGRAATVRAWRRGRQPVSLQTHATVSPPNACTSYTRQGNDVPPGTVVIGVRDATLHRTSVSPEPHHGTPTTTTAYNSAAVAQMRLARSLLRPPSPGDPFALTTVETEEPTCRLDAHFS